MFEVNRRLRLRLSLSADMQPTRLVIIVVSLSIFPVDCCCCYSDDRYDHSYKNIDFRIENIKHVFILHFDKILKT